VISYAIVSMFYCRGRQIRLVFNFLCTGRMNSPLQDYDPLIKYWANLLPLQDYDPLIKFMTQCELEWKS